MKTNLILALTFFVAAMTAVSAADAAANWKTHCAKCHGEDGKGETTMGKKLKVGDYTSADVQKKFTDEEAAKVIKEGKKVDGKTAMKAFAELLSDEEIKGLVKHVREFKK